MDCILYLNLRQESQSQSEALKTLLSLSKLLKTYIVIRHMLINAGTVACENPGLVPNAILSASSGPYLIGTIVNYLCNNGYSGGGYIFCQPNGQWSQKPTCSPGMNFNFFKLKFPFLQT